MNKPLALEMKLLSLHRDPVGEHGGGSFTGYFEGKVWKKALETGVCLRSGPLGNLGSLLTGNFKRQLEGSGKGASLFAGALLGEFLSGVPEGYEEGAQGMDIIISGGPAGECSRWLVYRGLSKALEMDTFLYRGPIKYHGHPFTGISERYLNGDSGNGAALSVGALLGEPGGGSFVKDPEY